MKLILKTLIATLLLLGAISCSKLGYKPDHDQVTCERCISITTKWQEPEMIHEIGQPDTVLNRRLCEQTLLDYKRNILTEDTLIKICNTNGEAIYWVHYKDTSFISK